MHLKGEKDLSNFSRSVASGTVYQVIAVRKYCFWNYFSIFFLSNMPENTVDDAKWEAKFASLLAIRYNSSMKFSRFKEPVISLFPQNAGSCLHAASMMLLRISLFSFAFSLWMRMLSCHSSKARSILLCPNVFRASRLWMWTSDLSCLAIARAKLLNSQYPAVPRGSTRRPPVTLCYFFIFLHFACLILLTCSHFANLVCASK